jgi:hypothetical protein
LEASDRDSSLRFGMTEYSYASAATARGRKDLQYALSFSKADLASSSTVLMLKTHMDRRANASSSVKSTAAYLSIVSVAIETLPNEQFSSLNTLKTGSRFG